MLYVRALLFTILMPGAFAFLVPLWLAPESNGGSTWGWTIIAVGSAGYFISALAFLLAGGTPAIFFARPVRAVVGEEPQRLVSGWLYAHTRNPMYQSVVLVILGQAWLRGSWTVVWYGLAMAIFFHGLVTLVEEPHLRQHREGYRDYCDRVPRWGWKP